MNGIALLLAITAVGIDSGRQTIDDGHLEHPIQVEPRALETLREGGDELSPRTMLAFAGTVPRPYNTNVGGASSRYQTSPSTPPGVGQSRYGAPPPSAASRYGAPYPPAGGYVPTSPQAAVGIPAVGIPVAGAPVVGAPVVGAPVAGVPVAGVPAARVSSTAIQPVSGQTAISPSSQPATSGQARSSVLGGGPTAGGQLPAGSVRYSQPVANAATITAGQGSGTTANPPVGRSGFGAASSSIFRRDSAQGSIRPPSGSAGVAPIAGPTSSAGSPSSYGSTTATNPQAGVPTRSRIFSGNAPSSSPSPSRALSNPASGGLGPVAGSPVAGRPAAGRPVAGSPAAGNPTQWQGNQPVGYPRDTRGAIPATAANGASPNANGANPNAYGANPNAYGANPNTNGANPNAYGVRPNAYGARPNAAAYGANAGAAGANTGGYGAGASTYSAGAARGAAVGPRMAEGRATGQPYTPAGAPSGPNFPSLQPPAQARGSYGNPPAGQRGSGVAGHAGTQPLGHNGHVNIPPRVPVTSGVSPARGATVRNDATNSRGAGASSLWPLPVAGAASRTSPPLQPVGSPAAGSVATSGGSPLAPASTAPANSGPASNGRLAAGDSTAGGLNGNGLPNEDERPWVPLTLTMFGLLLSLGANAYLAWIALGLHTRYRELVYEIRHSQAATTSGV